MFTFFASYGRGDIELIHLGILYIYMCKNYIMRGQSVLCIFKPSNMPGRIMPAATKTGPSAFDITVFNYDKQFVICLFYRKPPRGNFFHINSIQHFLRFCCILLSLNIEGYQLLFFFIFIVKGGLPNRSPLVSTARCYQQPYVFSSITQGSSFSRPHYTLVRIFLPKYFPCDLYFLQFSYTETIFLCFIHNVMKVFSVLV